MQNACIFSQLKDELTNTNAFKKNMYEDFVMSDQYKIKSTDNHH